AVTIGLHHVVMLLVAPEAAFAGGGSPGIAMIHTLFVFVEAAGLAYVAERLRHGLTEVGSAADHLAEARLPELVATMRAVSEGDLTHAIRIEPATPDDGGGDDELGRLALAFDRMQQETLAAAGGLQEMIEHLRTMGEWYALGEHA